VRMVGSTHFIDAIVEVPRTFPIDASTRSSARRRPRCEGAGDADLTFTAVPVARRQ